MRSRSVASALVLGAAAALGCASAEPRAPADDYLRWVSVEVPVNENVLLRWKKREMPLRVHLPRPPAGFFEDPAAIHDVVRDGVLDWTDVAGPGLPSFRFVDDPGAADIPIVWEREPSGDWYIAHCAYDINRMTRTFGVARILVTSRWRGEAADMHDVYAAVLHEMGHALGLAGHSPVQGDIMYPRVRHARGLSDRDRRTLERLYARPLGARVVGARDFD